MNKLVILYKTINLDNDIYHITKKYCNSFINVESYFLIEDNIIDNDIILNENIIKVKIESDNWSSLLIKVIKAFMFLLDKDYTHIMVANISSFINIPLLYKKLSKNCMAPKDKYIFKNIEYEFPSGAGYIFTKNIVTDICNFFNINNYIINNKFNQDFITNFPTTDDIFFGYYFYINQINIESLDRLDILTNLTITDTHYSHYRIKTLNKDYDAAIFSNLYNIIYNQ